MSQTRAGRKTERDKAAVSRVLRYVSHQQTARLARQVERRDIEQAWERLARDVHNGIDENREFKTTGCRDWDHFDLKRMGV